LPVLRVASLQANSKHQQKTVLNRSGSVETPACVVGHKTDGSFLKLLRGRVRAVVHVGEIASNLDLSLKTARDRR